MPSMAAWHGKTFWGDLISINIVVPNISQHGTRLAGLGVGSGNQTEVLPWHTNTLFMAFYFIQYMCFGISMWAVVGMTVFMWHVSSLTLLSWLFSNVALCLIWKEHDMGSWPLNETGIKSSSINGQACEQAYVLCVPAGKLCFHV